MKPRSFQATQTVLPGNALGPSVCVKGPSDDFLPSVFSELALGLSWAGDLLMKPILKPVEYCTESEKQNGGIDTEWF